MDLEGQGQLSNLGGQGTASGQLGLASETRGEAEERIAFQVAMDESAREADLGQDDNESIQESDEEDRQSQVASLANTVDSSMDLVIIMPDKIPVCFLCSFNQNPLTRCWTWRCW